MALLVAGVTPTLRVTGNELGSVYARMDFDVANYLPPGSTIADPRKDVVSADVDGDKEPEVVVFYMRPDRNFPRPAILILKRHGDDYVVFWEKVFDVGHGFSAPTGVSDLAKSGVPQVVAHRSVGASCDSQLDIYAYRSGEIQRVVQWDPGTCQASLEFRDLDGDGIPEIIFTTRNYGSIPDIYRWNGQAWALSNTRFPGYYDGESKKLLAEVYSVELMPVSWRMASVDQIVQIYSIEKRYAETIRLCEHVLVALDNPALTGPNVTAGKSGTEGQEAIESALQHEKAQAKATLYRIQANAYRAMGDEGQAKRLYEAATKVEANR